MAQRTTNSVLAGLLMLAAFPAKVQAIWMPEGFRVIYDNGFAKNYERSRRV